MPGSVRKLVPSYEAWCCHVLEFHTASVPLVCATSTRKSSSIQCGQLSLLWVTIDINFFQRYDIRKSCCVRRQEKVTHNLGIPVVLSWDSCGTQLGFLWYSVVIFVLLSWDSCALSVIFLSYVCIFCAILNNLSRFVTSQTNAQMANAHLVSSSFICKKLISFKVDSKCTRLFIGRNVEF